MENPKIQMSKFAIFILTCCCVLNGVTAYSTQNFWQSPPRYYEDYGACPFECCTYRRWIVKSDTIFYKQRSTSSPVVFSAKKGDPVTGLTGVVITLKPGEVRIKKATTLGEGRRKVSVKAGDVLYVLRYEGEGIYKFWFHGRIYADHMPSSPNDIGDEHMQMLSEPQTVWWVKVKNRRGQIGWSKQADHFDNMDACG